MFYGDGMRESDIPRDSAFETPEDGRSFVGSGIAVDIAGLRDNGGYWRTGSIWPTYSGTRNRVAPPSCMARLLETRTGCSCVTVHCPSPTARTSRNSRKPSCSSYESRMDPRGVLRRQRGANDCEGDGAWRRVNGVDVKGVPHCHVFHDAVYSGDVSGAGWGDKGGGGGERERVVRKRDFYRHWAALY